MSAHDPLCPSSQDPRCGVCCCVLVARVREDERRRLARLVRERMFEAIYTKASWWQLRRRSRREAQVTALSHTVGVVTSSGTPEAEAPEPGAHEDLRTGPGGS